MTAYYDNLYLCMDPCNLGPPNKLFWFVGNHHKVFFGIIQNESEGGEDKEDLIATAKDGEDKEDFIATSRDPIPGVSNLGGLPKILWHGTTSVRIPQLAHNCI